MGRYGRYRGPETPELREKLIKKGLGQGTGSKYQPWIRVGDFSNLGESYRIWCFKTGRIHHYLSGGEYRNHLVSETLQEVTDIREQYPILPISETLDLAEQLRIAHPSFGGQFKTLTIDSLLTVDDGRALHHFARSIKQNSDLANPRIRELLELERRACAQRGYIWALLTEKELSQTLEKNLRWLRKWLTVNRDAPDASTQIKFVDAFCDADLTQTVSHILDDVSKKLAISKLLATHFFRHAVWTHAIQIDMYAPLQLTKPHLALASNKRRGKHAA